MVDRYKKLQGLFFIQSLIRQFFAQRDFIDVLTPVMVENPGIEPHLHPFKVHGLGPYKQKELYLHTSPEFHMKELLSLGFHKIFTLNYCFRHEPPSSTHRPQFLMLEWYRQNQRYEAIMEDLDCLINFCTTSLNQQGFKLSKCLDKPIVKKTMSEIFVEFAGFDYLQINSSKEFSELIRTKWPEVPLPKEDLSYDDLFHLFFLNVIEPHLTKYPKLIIYEYPASQAALSTIKKEDPRVCERFEFYLHGIEICNAFNELCSYEEQVQRVLKAQKEKISLYGSKHKLPSPNVLLEALKRGIHSPSSGVALGVERLYRGLTEVENPFWD